MKAVPILRMLLAAASKFPIGVYLGKGLLIQAPHTGDHVRISRAWTDVAIIRRMITRP